MQTFVDRPCKDVELLIEHTHFVHPVRMSELTDPSKAAQLFSSGSANAISFDAEAIWGVTWFDSSLLRFCHIGAFDSGFRSPSTIAARYHLPAKIKREGWKVAEHVPQVNIGKAAEASVVIVPN